MAISLGQPDPRLSLACTVQAAARLGDAAIELRPVVGGAEDQDAEARAELARILYRLRRRRELYFGPGCFSEPAWDILLDLYIAAAEGRSISVSSACIGSSSPSTTALRWLAQLEQDGSVIREVDRGDRRRSLVRLSPEALAGMRSLLDDIRAMIEAGDIPKCSAQKNKAAERGNR